MLSFNDVNILGSIIDNTFGRSSSYGGGASIKCHLAGETLVVTYHEVCNIARDRDKFEQIRPVIERAQKCVKEKKKEIESEFKRAAGRSLKLKESSEGNALDPMGYNFLNPVRPCHFKHTATYTIG